MAKNQLRNVFSMIIITGLIIYCWIWINAHPEDINWALRNVLKTHSTLKPAPVNFFNKSLDNSTGVIVTVNDGIGNQLFKYACSYALAKKRNTSLYTFVNRNRSFLQSRKFSAKDRGYALDKFQIPLETNLIDASTKINPSRVSYITDLTLFYGNYTEKPLFQLWEHTAYCLSDVFFEDYKTEILQMFRMKPEVINAFPRYVTEEIGKEIESSNQSVCVHVRRGDIAGTEVFEVPISYQRTAMVKMIKKLGEQRIVPKFYVFSDDIIYAKQSFKDFARNHTFVFVSGSHTEIDGHKTTTTSLQDFYLMMKCRHFIIPSSTFAWWAVYLGTGGKDVRREGRIVIAPSFSPSFYRHFIPEWQSYFKMQFKELFYPKGWIVIDPWDNMKVKSYNN